MATITVGSGSTLKSSTAEGQVMELLTFLQKKEKELSAEDKVQITYNLNSFTFSASFSIPATQAINSSGQLVISASEYMTGLTFVTGSGGTFKSSTSTQYLIELISYLQLKEQDLTKNTANENRVSGQYDIDDKLFTGTVNLGVTAEIDSVGKILISAVEYLLT
jgi:hypothetical protein